MGSKVDAYQVPTLRTDTAPLGFARIQKAFKLLFLGMNLIFVVQRRLQMCPSQLTLKYCLPG